MVHEGNFRRSVTYCTNVPCGLSAIAEFLIKFTDSTESGEPNRRIARAVVRETVPISAVFSSAVNILAPDELHIGRGACDVELAPLNKPIIIFLSSVV